MSPDDMPSPVALIAIYDNQLKHRARDTMVIIGFSEKIATCDFVSKE